MMMMIVRKEKLHGGGDIWGAPWLLFKEGGSDRK